MINARKFAPVFATLMLTGGCFAADNGGLVTASGPDEISGGLMLKLAERHLVMLCKTGADDAPVLTVNARLGLAEYPAGKALGMGENFIWEMLPGDDGVVLKFGGIRRKDEAQQAVFMPSSPEKFWLSITTEELKFLQIMVRHGKDFPEQELADIRGMAHRTTAGEAKLRGLVWQIASLLAKDREVFMQKFDGVPALFTDVKLDRIAYHQDDGGRLSNRFYSWEKPRARTSVPNGVGLVIKFFGPDADGQRSAQTAPADMDDTERGIFEHEIKLADGCFVTVSGQCLSDFPKQKWDEVLRLLNPFFGDEK